MLQQHAHPQASDGLDDDIHVAPSHLLAKLYAFFYNKKVGLILILVTGLLTLLGVLARQMPDSARFDPAQRAAWLEQVRPIYGGWTDIVDALGIFHIFSSPIFLTVTALLALSIIACTTHRLPLLYRKAYRPHTHVRSTFYEHAKLATEIRSPKGQADALAAATAALRKSGHRVIADADGETLYVDRFHWAPFGTAAAHLGYVVVMAGFLVSSFAGFRIDNFDLTVGIPRDVGHGTGLTAEARSFTDTYDDQWGTPIDYVSDLVVSRDGAELSRQMVRVNDPLIIDGIYFHQASFGISAVITVRDAQGQELFHDGVPLAWNTPDERGHYGVAVLEEQGVEVFVIANASGARIPGLEAGQVRVETYPVDSRTPLGQAIVDAGSSAQVGELTVGFEREQQYTSLIVKRDPGTAIVWIGCALLIVGTCLTMGLPHRRQWVRVTPDGDGVRIQVATPDKPDSARRRLFDQLARSIQGATEGTERKA